MFHRALILIAFTALSSLTWADPGDMRSADPVQTGRGILANKPTPALRKASRSAALMPQTLPNYSVTPFAQRSGAVSGLAAHNQVLFGLDRQRGRIMRYADRRGAGQSRQSSTFISGLSAPSGLQVHGDDLYYTDALGLWRVPIGRGLTPADAPQRLVDLSRVNAKPSPRPFALINDGAQALVGFSAPDPENTAEQIHGPAAQSIISVDLQSGAATIFATTVGRILALEVTPVGHVIAITQDDGAVQARLRVFTAQGLQSAELMLEPGGAPTDILLTPNGPWGDILIAFRGGGEDGRGGFHVSAVSFTLGAPEAEYQVIVDGFALPNRRAAWGRPVALAHFGEDGIIIADDWSETLWRLSPQEEAEENSEAVQDPEGAQTPPVSPEDQNEPEESASEDEETDKPTRIRIGGQRRARGSQNNPRP